MEKFALIKSLGFSECEEDSLLAYELYDKWSHCELTLEEAIEFVLENGMDEDEADVLYMMRVYLVDYRTTECSAGTTTTAFSHTILM